MEILIPVIITLVIGLILGLLLAILSKVFNVPVDEKITKLREALPGANCGGCGYAGCDDYAAALADGAPADKCAVGGKESFSKICEILGESGELIPKKAFVRCGGNIDYTQDKMDYRGIGTCKGANMYFQGTGKCDYGCLGMGDCVKACKFGAISVKNGAAEVDRTLCTGCGACVRACPDHLIVLLPADVACDVRCSNCEKGVLTRKACTHGCIACGKCVKTCESGAIKIENGFLAEIDHSLCKNCGKCAEVCPTGALINIKNMCSANSECK